MKIAPFAVEQWMNEYETGATYNIAETCVDSVSMDELFALTGTDKKAFLDDFCSRRLTYGYIEGRPDFKKGLLLCIKRSHQKKSSPPMALLGPIITFSIP